MHKGIIVQNRRLRVNGETGQHPFIWPIKDQLFP